MAINRFSPLPEDRAGVSLGEDLNSIAVMPRGVGSTVKGQAVTYTLIDGKKIQKVTDMVMGTGLVVASLWNFEDSSTAQLIASFYKNLKTMTKVEALRQAQLNLIRGNVISDLLARRGVGGVGRLGEVPAAKPASDSISPLASVSTSHPYFWAPFILVGEGK